MPRFPIRSIAAAIVVVFLFACRSASAMTVSPVKFDPSIAPGSSFSGTITLINESESRETYSVSAKNFIASGEEGAQSYIDEAEPAGLASWVRIAQPLLALDPKSSVEVPFTVFVPADAEPGGHYATIFFTRGAGTAGGSSVGIAEQVGVLLLVSVPGNVRESLAVDSFRVAGPSMMDRLPVSLELRVRNLGSVHEKLAGTIDIRNMFGNVVVRLDVNPKRAAVLPNSVRRFSNGWQKNLASDAKGFAAGAAEEWKNFGFGKYTASVNATFGSRGERIASSAIGFWIIPWRLLVIGGAVAVLLILLVVLYNRMLIRIALRKARR